MKAYTRVRADIDLDAIRFNFENMHRNLTPGTKITAVIKADGYGHGAVPIAEMMEPCDYIWGFAVATAEEALKLRRAGVKKPVILLGPVFPEHYEDLIGQDVRLCVFTMAQAEGVSEAALSMGRKARIHMALDTGMSRIGLQADRESAKTAADISRLPGIEVEGLFTHLARADEVSVEPALRQIERYKVFVGYLDELGVEIPVKHVSNSAGIIRLKEANFDMVRAGITVYGLMPSNDVEKDIVPLRAAMRIVSHISFVKTLPAGREIGYGGTYTTVRETRVATIPVGYADGYPRGLSNKGCVLISGRRVPILGRVCMDQFMVDVTDIPEAKEGDEVVLLGAQGNETLTAEELGDVSGRFNYELVCDFSARVPRNYLLGGNIVKQLDPFG